MSLDTTTVGGQQADKVVLVIRRVGKAKCIQVVVSVGDGELVIR
jgi:hypothetical protein